MTNMVELGFEHPDARIVPGGSWQVTWAPKRRCTVVALRNVPDGVLVTGFRVGAVDCIPLRQSRRGPLVRWELPTQMALCMPGIIVSAMMSNPTAKAIRIGAVRLEVDQGVVPL